MLPLHLQLGHSGIPWEALLFSGALQSCTFQVSVFLPSPTSTVQLPFPGSSSLPSPASCIYLSTLDFCLFCVLFAFFLNFCMLIGWDFWMLSRNSTNTLLRNFWNGVCNWQVSYVSSMCWAGMVEHGINWLFALHVSIPFTIDQSLPFFDFSPISFFLFPGIIFLFFFSFL